jgi:hypothetical protein
VLPDADVTRFCRLAVRRNYPEYGHPPDAQEDPPEVGQLEHISDEPAGDAILTANVENAFAGEAAPHFGHFAGISASVLTSTSNCFLHLAQLYSYIGILSDLSCYISTCVPPLRQAAYAFTPLAVGRCQVSGRSAQRTRRLFSRRGAGNAEN